jgi:hypothetical protein
MALTKRRISNGEQNHVVYAQNVQIHNRIAHPAVFYGDVRRLQAGPDASDGLFDFMGVAMVHTTSHERAFGEMADGAYAHMRGDHILCDIAVSLYDIRTAFSDGRPPVFHDDVVFYVLSDGVVFSYSRIGERRIDERDFRDFSKEQDKDIRVQDIVRRLDRLGRPRDLLPESALAAA